MSIKQNYPPNRPEIIYNVINGPPELPINNTFTRASAASYVDRTGLIVNAAVNEPRFTYDQFTKEFEGLLLEEASTNYFPQNFSFSQISGLQGDSTYSYTDTISTPFGTQVCGRVGVTATGGSTSGYIQQTVVGSINNRGVASVYAKADPTNPAKYFTLGIYGAASSSSWVNYVIFDMATGIPVSGTGGQGATSAAYSIDVGDGWRRYVVWTTSDTRTSPNPLVQCMVSEFYPSAPVTANIGAYICGAQYESSALKTPIPPTSCIFNNTDSELARAVDNFSLTTSYDFNQGFSLLLDSETTTDTFIYKIYEGANERIALENDNGNLKWDINGTSAQSEGTYPQVGFTKGRVRTISSLGIADGTDQTNYLYTTGLSFPTEAVVPPDLDSITFGVPQTVKALYVWNGQLSSLNAVSVIKGLDNVVPDTPIDVNSFAFILDSDVDNDGTTLVTLPNIVPQTTLTVDWGDGTGAETFNSITTLTHNYPYPGLYQVQINAATGYSEIAFRESNVGAVRSVIQWPPEYRAGASGPGFTGDEAFRLLYYQTNNNNVPPFKYTDLTTLSGTFYLNYNTIFPSGAEFDWVPTQLDKCTAMVGTFTNLSSSVSSQRPITTFPQLITSSELTSVSNCFNGAGVTTWLDTLSNPAMPFTDTSKVTNFQGCFANCGISSLPTTLDTSSATITKSLFAGNNFTTFPVMDFSNVTDMGDCFSRNSPMTSFPTTYDFSKVQSCGNSWFSSSNLASFPLYSFPECKDFTTAWRGCSNLTSFGGITFGNVSNINVSQAWDSCTSLTSFPSLDWSNVVNFTSAWYNCTALTGWAANNTMGDGVNFPNTWMNCTNLVNFELIDTSSATSFQNTWRSCLKMTGLSASPGTFPSLNTSNVKSVNTCWYRCELLTTFPALDLSSVTDFTSGWYQCTGLTAFPNIDTSSGTTFFQTWTACTNIPSFDLSNLSFANAVTCKNAWLNCSSLTTFPANKFDSTGALQTDAFDQAWTNCALTAQSIENILISLDTNGASNVALGLDGGSNAAKSTWSTAANTAYTNLIGKGWTIDFNA